MSLDTKGKAFIAGVLILASVVVVIPVGLSHDVDATYSDFPFTYEGYTVNQTGVEATESNGSYTATVTYSIVGPENFTDSYSIRYTLVSNDNGKFASTASSGALTGSSSVVIVPPKVVISDSANTPGQGEYFLSNIGAAFATTNGNATTEKLYIIADEGRTVGISAAQTFVKMSALKDLRILPKVTVSVANFVVNCHDLTYVDLGELTPPSTTSNQLIGINANSRTVTDGLKIVAKLPATGIGMKFVSASLSAGVTLELKSGTTKMTTLNLTNINTVRVDSADFPNIATVNELADSVTSGSAEIVVYGSSQPASYSVSIAQNQTGVSVDTENASEGDVVTITLTPGQGKQVGAVSVVKEDNESVQTTVDAQNPNVYTFVMPASDVTVSATFEDIPAVAITPASDTVAKGASTTVTVSAVGLKNVSSLYITITYDEAKFNLKSPAYSNLLSSAPLKGDLTKGEYVVAFATAQDISGDLLTFQLEAKDDAAVGACTIGCTVEINGTASGNSNTPEHTYTDTSALTIGNVLGDLDSDGDVDEDDAVYLLLYTFRASTYPIPEGQNVDYNNDGVINSDDAICLKNYVVNPTQYPLGGA